MRDGSTTTRWPLSSTPLIYLTGQRSGRYGLYVLHDVTFWHGGDGALRLAEHLRVNAHVGCHAAVSALQRVRHVEEAAKGEGWTLGTSRRRLSVAHAVLDGHGENESAKWWWGTTTEEDSR